MKNGERNLKVLLLADYCLPVPSVVICIVEIFLAKDWINKGFDYGYVLYFITVANILILVGVHTYASLEGTKKIHNHIMGLTTMVYSRWYPVYLRTAAVRLTAVTVTGGFYAWIMINWLHLTIWTLSFCLNSSVLIFAACSYNLISKKETSDSEEPEIWISSPLPQKNSQPNFTAPSFGYFPVNQNSNPSMFSSPSKNPPMFSEFDPNAYFGISTRYFPRFWWETQMADLKVSPNSAHRTKIEVNYSPTFGSDWRMIDENPITKEMSKSTVSLPAEFSSAFEQSKHEENFPPAESGSYSKKLSKDLVTRSNYRSRRNKYKKRAAERRSFNDEFVL